jgi:hypothetical protein
VLRVSFAVAAWLTAGCSSDPFDARREARFVLVEINLQPLHSYKPPGLCPRVLEGELLFSDWPSRRRARAVTRHIVQMAMPEAPDEILEESDVGTYTRLNDQVIWTYSGGRSTTFTVEDGGARLRFGDHGGGCYPGQTSAAVTPTLQLVYQRDTTSR